jgi:hypothetical protein
MLIQTTFTPLRPPHEIAFLQPNNDEYQVTSSNTAPLRDPSDLCAGHAYAAMGHTNPSTDMQGISAIRPWPTSISEVDKFDLPISISLILPSRLPIPLLLGLLPPAPIP